MEGILDTKLDTLFGNTSAPMPPVLHSPEPGQKRSHSPQIDADRLGTQQPKRFAEYSGDYTRKHGDCTNKSVVIERNGQSMDCVHKPPHTQSMDSSTELVVWNNEGQTNEQDPHLQQPSLIKVHNHSNNHQNRDNNQWQHPMVTSIDSSTGEYIQNSSDQISKFDETLEYDKSNDKTSECVLISLKNPSTDNGGGFNWYIENTTKKICRREIFKKPSKISKKILNGFSPTVMSLIHEIRNEQTSYVPELFDRPIMKCFRKKLGEKVHKTLMDSKKFEFVTALLSKNPHISKKTIIESNYDVYSLYRNSFDVRSDCETFDKICQNSHQNSHSALKPQLDCDKATQQSHHRTKFQQIVFLGPDTATYSILRTIMRVSLQIISHMEKEKTVKTLTGYKLLYARWMVRERLFKILLGKPFSVYVKGTLLHKLYRQYYCNFSDAIFVMQIDKIRSIDFPSMDQLKTTVVDSLKLANPSHVSAIMEAGNTIIKQILNKRNYENFVIEFNYVMYSLLVQYRLCKIYDALNIKEEVEILSTKLFEEYWKQHSVQANHRLIDQLIRGKTSFVEYLDNKEVELEDATKLEKDLTEQVQKKMHENLDKTLDGIFGNLALTLKIHKDIPTTKNMPSDSDGSHLLSIRSKEPADTNDNTDAVFIHTKINNLKSKQSDRDNCQNNTDIEKDNVKQTNKESHSLIIVNAAENTQCSNIAIKTERDHSKSETIIGDGAIPLNDDDITVPKIVMTKDNGMTENAMMEELIPTKQGIRTETSNKPTTMYQKSITLTTDLHPKDGNSEELQQPNAISKEANLATPDNPVDETPSNALFEEKVKNKVQEYIRASLSSIKDKLRSETINDRQLHENLGIYPPPKPLYTTRPILMQIYGDPKLPDLDKIQEVLEKFKPLSYKIYPHVPDVIFVDFSSENDAIELLQQSFVLDGNVISIAKASAPDSSCSRHNNAEATIDEQANPGNHNQEISYHRNASLPTADGETLLFDEQEQCAPRDNKDFETIVSRIDNQLHDLFIALKESEED